MSLPHDSSTPASRTRRVITEQVLSRRFSRDASVERHHLLSEVQRAHVTRFVARTLAGEYRFVENDCPCGVLADETIVSNIDRYGLPLNSAVCMHCGTVRTNPYLDTASLERFYRDQYQEFYQRAIQVNEYFARQQIYGAKVLAAMADQLPNRASVLEIGCGAGGALEVFQRHGHQVAGCEFSSELIAYGRERGVASLHEGDLNSAEFTRNRRFDLIYMHHVFEHVASPLNMLEQVQTLLNPGGRILVIVPDLSRIDQCPNPAGDALQFFHIAHKFNYTIEGMQHLGRRATLEVRQVNPPAAMPTPWSCAPELWVELRAASASALPVLQDTAAGARMVSYLRRTETLYRWGLCRAQLTDRAERWMQRKPLRSVRKLGRLWAPKNRAA